MAEYLVMIVEDEARWADADPQTYEAVLAAHREFGQRNGPHLRSGNRLRGSDTATSIRRDGSGKVVVTDGAFTEAKEVLGGYYVIDAADLDEAITIAAQVPAPFGGVELRPMWPVDE